MTLSNVVVQLPDRTVGSVGLGRVGKEIVSQKGSEVSIGQGVIGHSSEGDWIYPFERNHVAWERIP